MWKRLAVIKYLNISFHPPQKSNAQNTVSAIINHCLLLHTETHTHSHSLLHTLTQTGRKILCSNNVEQLSVDFGLIKCIYVP